jgi:hypothetical protein
MPSASRSTFCNAAMIFLIASFASMNRRTTQPKMDRRVTPNYWNANPRFGMDYRQVGASAPPDSAGHEKHSCPTRMRAARIRNSEEKSQSGLSNSGWLIRYKVKTSKETMSACIANSYGDRYRDFERSCWNHREGSDSRERSEEKRNSTQIDHEVVETKGPLAVMNFAKNRKARSSADRQAEALAILASPNLPSVLPMGAFPLTLAALGHVSRGNFDNMAP